MKKRVLSALFAVSLLLIAISPFSPASASPSGAAALTDAISPTWVNAGDFSDGLAAVYDGSKWGYINGEGEPVIEYLYDIANEFHEGVATVAVITAGNISSPPYTETWYLIDKSGTVVQSLGSYTRYYQSSADYVSCVNSGTYVVNTGAETRLLSVRPSGAFPNFTSLTSAAVFNEGYAVIGTDSRGNFTYPDWMTSSHVAVLPYLNSDMLIDLEGKITWNTDWGTLLSYDNGLVPVNSRSAGLWGFASASGEYVISPVYEDFWFTYRYGVYTVFHDGVASVIRGGAPLAIDTLGNALLYPDADKLGIYSEGLFAFEKNGKWGYMDIEGNVVIAAQYASAQPFKNGAAVVTSDNGNYHLIDKTGARLNSAPYSFIASFSEGLARVCVNGRYGYVALSGQIADSPYDIPAFWATEYIDSAVENGLIPHEFFCRYTQPATRAEFSKLVITMLTRHFNCTLDELVLSKTDNTLDSYVSLYNFIDTADRYVTAAYALGIVEGRGGGVFDPNGRINRQEAAKMLSISAQIAGITASGEPLAFGDRDTFHPWAVEYIDFVSAAGIMIGDEKGNFTPFDYYTLQQAITTMLRIFTMPTQ